MVPHIDKRESILEAVVLWITVDQSGDAANLHTILQVAGRMTTSSHNRLNSRHIRVNDHVSYNKYARFEIKFIGRWIGVSHRAKWLILYWILTQKGGSAFIHYSANTSQPKKGDIQVKIQHKWI